MVLGPAALGLIQPGPEIQLLAEIGIFFLMFHAGVETQPLEFYDALMRSMGVAVVGAIVPFVVSFGVAWSFGLDLVGATFVGLTMTATAVVITLKSLKDLDLANTRVARVIVASCVIDDLLTLVFFGLVIGVLSGGEFEPINFVITLGKVVGFFAVAILLGRFVYPRLTLPFPSEGGKGFTFVLMTAIGAGLFAEAIGCCRAYSRSPSSSRSPRSASMKRAPSPTNPLRNPEFAPAPGHISWRNGSTTNSIRHLRPIR